MQGRGKLLKSEKTAEAQFYSYFKACLIKFYSNNQKLFIQYNFQLPSSSFLT
jgi:hypothetical protein